MYIHTFYNINDNNANRNVTLSLCSKCPLCINTLYKVLSLVTDMGTT